MWPASPKWPWRPASCTGTNPMQTPWGDFHVCDAHVHFFSPAFFASLAAESGQPPLEMEEIGRILDRHIPSSCEDLAAAWKQELDEYSVAKAAFFASLAAESGQPPLEMEEIGRILD